MNAMKTRLQKTFFRSVSLSTLALLIVGCASQATAPDRSAASSQEGRTALACALPSNCVNSLSSSGLAPLHFEGSATQAIAALRATLAEFPEAKIVKTDSTSMEAVFSTPIGFKDLVDFKIDAHAQRIDFRSRSSFGLYDFGKNRSRMSAFSAKFAQIAHY
jgi:uncharacterized protein (DUF1499 family)